MRLNRHPPVARRRFDRAAGAHLQPMALPMPELPGEILPLFDLAARARARL